MSSCIFDYPPKIKKSDTHRCESESKQNSILIENIFGFTKLQKILKDEKGNYH